MRVHALLFAGLLVVFSLIAAPANAAGKPVRTLTDISLDVTVETCGFPVRLQATGASIELNFGGRLNIVAPGTEATLTNLATGTSLRVAIPGPEFVEFNQDGSPNTVSLTGPSLFAHFHPATREPGIWLTQGRLVLDLDADRTEFDGTSRNLCTALA
jgi:hypothetical protein